MVLKSISQLHMLCKQIVGIFFAQVMTNGIANNFPHHANTWMTKSIMPSLE
jgi:hypothetical protein